MAERIKYNLNRAIQIKDTRAKKNSVAGAPFTSLRSLKQTDNLKPKGPRANIKTK